MAEVYLGTHQGIGGFRKLVVMKHLLGWQSDDHEAIESLLDEARIAATLNHPNVVTTLDIGLDRGSPFIVLEYLSGENLLHVLQELHARSASIPLGIVCRIGASIAAALSQAHDLTMPDGSRRCIVHRDVTPSNIIVCFGGVTKLVDFGVARVVDDVPKTKAGLVKGKFSYLAPEQLSGAPLDGRTDVFQLGIVLWEMVTMRRLFDGGSDHERVNAVLNRTIELPSTHNAALPPCLERTIMRALDRDPARRHQTAHELEVELLEALGTLGVSGGDHSVGKWMQSSFAERHRWRLDLERRTVAEAATALEDEDEVEVQIEPDGNGSTRPRGLRAATQGASGRSTRTSTSLRGIAVDVPAPVAPPRSNLWRYPLVAIGVVAAAVLTFQRAGGASGERAPEAAVAATPTVLPVAEYEVDLRVHPAHASIAIDGAVLAKGRYRGNFASDGSVHTVTFTAPDHATVQRRLQGAATLEVYLEALTSGAVEAAPAAVRPAPVSEPARSSRDGRRKRVERRPSDARTPDRVPAAATSGADDGGGDAAPPPRRPKSDDPFAPASDNLDPFATGS